MQNVHNFCLVFIVRFLFLLVTNPVEEMEFTECVPVEKIMANNFMEKVDEEIKTVQDTVGVVSFEETACIGGILKAAEQQREERRREREESIDLNETEKPVADAVSVNFEEISRVIPAENTGIYKLFFLSVFFY